MKKAFVTSFMIIGFFNVLDRMLGFFFKIYLSRALGAENLGVYQIALSLFFVLLTFITSGIPLVVSKCVARFLARGEKIKAGAITSAALIVSTLSAVILSLIVIIFFKPISIALGNQRSATILLYLLPALLFSAVYSSLRGNLWGREKFFSVAIVEIIEQVSRIISCVTLFMMGFDKLTVTALSLTIGCFISMIACIIFFVATKAKLYSPKGQIKNLFLSELPITLSRSARSLVSSLLAIVVPVLFVFSGYPENTAYELFGASQGMALPLLFTPMTIIGALAFVLIPSIGASVENGKTNAVHAQASGAICFSIVVACTFIPLFAECGKQIGLIVYDNAVSGEFLAYSAWILIPLSLEAITTSIMNSFDLEMKSFVSSMLGYVVQGAFYLLFVKGFTLQIFSLGLGLSMSVSCLINVRFICKKTGLKPTFLLCLVKCVVALLPCCLLTKCMLGIFSFLPLFWNVFISGSVGMLGFLLLCATFGMLDVNLVVARFRKKPKKKRITA